MRRALPMLLVAALSVLTACGPASAKPSPALPAGVVGLAAVAPGLNPAVLALALRASSCAARRGLVPALGLLTVIDYSRPSHEPRLWVLDLTTRTLRYHELVAHGRGSGELLATSFSNDAGSQQSSLGLFVTAESYIGQHGRSLRLVGLEPGTNDHALDRALVVHGAGYVSAAFAATQGRLGRSHGCPALRPEVSAALIADIQGGTPLFAYYPEPAWLERSPFLTGSCAAGR